MIFIHKESGELFELMITALADLGESEISTNNKAFRVGNFTLYGSGDHKKVKLSEIGLNFEFIGVL